MTFEIQSFGLGQPVVETSKEVLGGKGAGLVWMQQQGLRVPPGFILPTSLWADFVKKPKSTLKIVAKEIKPWLAKMEKHFGYMPLLSVRSGARVSCPGMMDTILNVGLESNNEIFWQKKLGETCYKDSLHRLIVMYGSVVKGIDRKDLEVRDLNSALALYAEKTGEPFPGAEAQLLGSIEAVFQSWNNDRAVFYRKMNNIPAEWGTACVVQAMVFGNLNMQSGSGVVFSRDCDTGLAVVNGDFLPGGQGEDVVAGIVAAPKLAEVANWNPGLHTEIFQTTLKLERLKRDVVDIEITVQDGVLYFLQVRTAQRSAQAAVKIALELMVEEIITPTEAAQRVTARQLDLAQLPVIDPSFKEAPAFTGIPACSGVVTGIPVFSSEAAVAGKAAGKKVILVTSETTPDDIEGMNAAVGVLTMQGGSTSHAAVVARGMNKPCVVGLGDYLKKFEGCIEISMDGATGRVWFQKVPVIEGDATYVTKFMQVIAETFNVTPVIFEAPKVKMPAALLSIGVNFLDTKNCVELITTCAAKVDTLYLDFGTRSSAQDSFLTQIGVQDSESEAVIASLAWMSNLVEKIVLVGRKFPGMKSLSTTSTLEDLVMAEGDLMVDNLTPAMRAVLKWKQAEGAVVSTLGHVSPLGTSFVSLEQAVQYVSSQSV